MRYQILVTVDMAPKNEDNPPTAEELRSEIQSGLVSAFPYAFDEVSVEVLPRVSHIERGPVSDRFMSMAEKRRHDRLMAEKEHHG